MSMIYFDDYMWCPIHPFSEHLNEGRDVADDTFTGPLFQSRIDDGKKECMCQFENGGFGALLDVL